MKCRLLPLLILVVALAILPQPLPAQLTAADVQTVINQAVSRAANISPNSVIAVTDREGYVLGIWVVRGGIATPGEIATAVSKAGTAAYLSSNQNAFTSRTAGFIIQQHFPPGVQFTPTGPLVGVGLSNLFITDVNRFKKIDMIPCQGLLMPCPPAFEPVSQGVFGSPIAYTSLDGSPGGVPLYKGGALVGGIGVTGDGTPQPSVSIMPDPASVPTLLTLPPCLLNRLGVRTAAPPFTNPVGPGMPFPTIARDENPFIFIGGYDIDEDVALAGQKGFTPSPTITADNVFINGIRLPYVVASASGTGSVSANTRSRRKRPRPTPNPVITLAGNADPEYPVQNPPAPFPYPMLTLGGVTGQVRQPIIDDPIPTPINGQPRLTAAEVMDVIGFAAHRANITRAGIRLPIGVPMQIFITVVNNPDTPDALECPPVVLGTFRTPDATFFSWDVAVQKARTAVFYSRHDFLHFGVNAAFSSRAVGFLAQRFYPPGIQDNGPGPFFTEQDKLSGLSGVEPGVTFTFTLDQPSPPLRNGIRFDLPNGITIFPGGFPLYRNGVLIGAIGISGDGVDQDDIAGASGTNDFLAPMAIRSDQFFFQGARLPYAKFPRDPGK